MAPSPLPACKPHRLPILINHFLSITLSLTEFFLCGDIKDWSFLESPKMLSKGFKMSSHQGISWPFYLTLQLPTTHNFLSPFIFFSLTYTLITYHLHYSFYFISLITLHYSFYLLLLYMIHLPSLECKFHDDRDFLCSLFTVVFTQCRTVSGSICIYWISEWMNEAYEMMLLSRSIPFHIY